MVTKKTVLIVDDERDLLEVLRSDVAEMGYQTLTAENGQEALAMVAQHPIDIILSDINMPKLTGIEFLALLRKKGFQHPFIVLSGYGTREEAIQLLRLGAFDFLAKPTSFEKLKERIGAAAQHVNLVNEAIVLVKERLGLTDIAPGSREEEAVYALARISALKRG
ncbi:MAG: response regulator [Bdellovibrionota bacterium]|nr:MAG: response regulator [Pseudomonadota bacterium]